MGEVIQPVPLMRVDLALGKGLDVRYLEGVAIPATKGDPLDVRVDLETGDVALALATVRITMDAGESCRLMPELPHPMRIAKLSVDSAFGKAVKVFEPSADCPVGTVIKLHSTEKG